MRISDDRYSWERLRLDLALRFLRHETPTQTIRTWTGLTDDRIRKPCRSSRGPPRPTYAVSAMLATSGECVVTNV